ncbi:MAG: helix-turn-helix domain-containing protein [Caldicoprobacterales bacterium]
MGEEMQIEKRMQKILDKIAKTIQVETDVVNFDGIIVASSDKSRIGNRENFIKTRVAAEKKNRFIFSGRTYIKFNVNFNHAYYLSMAGTGRVIRNYCILVISLIELYLKSTTQRMDREDIICAAMLGQISDLEFQEAVRAHNIDPVTPRCVFVIMTEGMEAAEIYRVMLNVFPKNMGDFLVLIDSQTVGLVKTVMDEMEEEELIQLGAAIEDTILSETSVKSYIGIGQVKNSIYDIRKSYKEAIIAMDIGRTYEPNNRIFFYESLLLERFLSEVPMNISERYYKHIFNGEFDRLLNDEMIITIEKFFENNLNLSETSRQLYIHRNTLVYRLDKIQKALGLDLRNFHDAVTFKIMMMLERQSREC